MSRFRFLLLLLPLGLAACVGAPSAVQSVAFESDPPGGRVELGDGQSCVTPCALLVSRDRDMAGIYRSAQGCDSRDLRMVPAFAPGDMARAPIVVRLRCAPPR